MKMQGTSSDILGVFSDIKDVVKTLSSVRQKVEENHAKWFQKACQIAEKLDITVQKPRTCQVQRNRANNPAETVEDLAVVTKKQQYSAYLLFPQCCWHQMKRGGRPLR